MANEKQIKARLQQKHDIEANWNLAPNFVPKQGELIVYDPDENYNYSRVKIGDGISTANELPFIIAVDTSLTQSGQAADAKAVGDALEGKQPIGDYVLANKLPEVIDDALAQAKESGEFDGQPGVDGADYVLTDADKSEIAEMAAELVEVPDSGQNVNPVDKTPDMTQPVGVDENGRLYTAPSGGGLSAIIEGEKLILAENSTAVIDGEKLIL